MAKSVLHIVPNPARGSIVVSDGIASIELTKRLAFLNCPGLDIAYVGADMATKPLKEAIDQSGKTGLSHQELKNVIDGTSILKEVHLATDNDVVSAGTCPVIKQQADKLLGRKN